MDETIVPGKEGGEVTLTTDEDRLTPDEATVSNEEVALKPDEEAISNKEVSLTSDEATISNKEVSLTSDEATVSYKEVSFSSDEGTVSNKEASLTSDEATVSDKEVSFASDEGTVSNKEVSLTSDEATVSDKEVSFTSDEATVSDKEATLTPDEATVSNKEVSLKSDEATVRDKEIEIFDLEDRDFIIDALIQFSRNLIVYIEISKYLDNTPDVEFLNFEKPYAANLFQADIHGGLIHIVNRFDHLIQNIFAEVIDKLDMPNVFDELVTMHDNKLFRCKDHLCHQQCPITLNLTLQSNILVFLAFTCRLAGLAHEHGVKEAYQIFAERITSTIMTLERRIRAIGGWKSINSFCKRFTEDPSLASRLRRLPCDKPLREGDLVSPF